MRKTTLSLLNVPISTSLYGVEETVGVSKNFSNKFAKIIKKLPLNTKAPYDQKPEQHGSL